MAAANVATEQVVAGSWQGAVTKLGIARELAAPHPKKLTC
jgi:hypothetical protein